MDFDEKLIKSLLSIMGFISCYFSFKIGFNAFSSQTFILRTGEALIGFGAVVIGAVLISAGVVTFYICFRYCVIEVVKSFFGNGK